MITTEAGEIWAEELLDVRPGFRKFRCYWDDRFKLADQLFKQAEPRVGAIEIDMDGPPTRHDKHGYRVSVHAIVTALLWKEDTPCG